MMCAPKGIFFVEGNDIGKPSVEHDIAKYRYVEKDVEYVPVIPLLMDAHIESLVQLLNARCGAELSQFQARNIYNAIRDWTAEPKGNES